MDINALTAVVTIADTGSFAAAARRLNISLPTVSLQVSRLEQQLNKRLFDRASRPPTITADGQRFVLRARRLLSQWDSLRNDTADDSPSGVFKIGAIHTQVRHLVPTALKMLHREAPELSVRLATGLTNELIDRVGRYGLDCAIITIPDYLSADVVCFELVSEPLVVIADRSAKGRGARQLLENNAYVQFNPDAEVARIVSELLQTHKIAINSHMQIDTLDAVISLVANGLGVSIVPLSVGASPLPKSIIVTKFNRPQRHRRIGLIMRKDAQRFELVGHFQRILQRIGQ